MTLEPSRGATGDKPGRERVSMSAQTHQDTPVQEHRSAGSTWLVVLAVALAQLLLFWVVSRFRFIDGDEAFCLIAARKVAEGSVVYRDFFYPQMPFLPSVYGTWTRLVGDGWFEGRLLSCVFAALTGTLLFEHLRRSIGGISWALLGVLLFGPHTHLAHHCQNLFTFDLLVDWQLGVVGAGAIASSPWAERPLAGTIDQHPALLRGAGAGAGIRRLAQGRQGS